MVTCREVTENCSTIASFVALFLGRASQSLFSQQSPILSRLGRCWDLLNEWLTGAREQRGAGILRAFLLFCLSIMAVLLSMTGLSLGKAISARIDEVVKSSEGKLLK